VVLGVVLDDTEHCSVLLSIFQLNFGLAFGLRHDPWVGFRVVSGHQIQRFSRVVLAHDL
jgi:hypothetical protein